MEIYYLILIAKIAVAAVLAVILGNGAVVWFNRMPARWFDDEGLPEGAEDRQRIPSTPWKYIFVVYFAATGIYLALNNELMFEIAVIFLLFIVLEMAISDIKFMVVPDQLSILLAVSGVGFIGFHDSPVDIIIGAVTGFIISAAVYGLGKLIYHTETIGGADMKFYSAIGIVTGVMGVLTIFILTTILTALHVIWLAFAKKISMREHRPMMPYALVSVTIYLLFFRDIINGLNL